MSSLTNTILEDMKTAMRERNKAALNVLRALKTAITNAAIEKSGAGTELPDNEVINIIRKQIKQRQDSIEQFENAGRAELAETEKEEIIVLETYLPAAMSQEEIEAAVDAAIAESAAESRKDIGKVMNILQEKTGGRADGKTLSQAVMKRLS
ncbi:GatB/YqeY domain-containing protein [Verrucomicrobiaceae bacterium R5-34]|uniref:GatB/YqeY domain-containing protein n=2 Tax=Oceaniferula flava TaxID=2800421 RepID=A0AAE2SHF8_9BACT|nr:GatB/YqeY domain-containing protein [Verrucomicrobiaceae bacterium R5-34]MBK1856431.1 GatB/YqeY domain-containing protein [Oceaniferula flavus]MBM1137738.1 GatB/YqeY domain-containing protein [Oceaniferula flavus]